MKGRYLKSLIYFIHCLYISPVGLKLMILLPQHTKCLDFSSITPYFTLVLLVFVVHSYSEEKSNKKIRTYLSKYRRKRGQTASNRWDSIYLVVSCFPCTTGSTPALHKVGMVAYTCIPSTQELGYRRSRNSRSFSDVYQV